VEVSCHKYVVVQSIDVVAVGQKLQFNLGDYVLAEAAMYITRQPLVAKKFPKNYRHVQVIKPRRVVVVLNYSQ
jgi:hypothetical protein